MLRGGFQFMKNVHPAARGHVLKPPQRVSDSKSLFDNLFAEKAKQLGVDLNSDKNDDKVASSSVSEVDKQFDDSPASNEEFQAWLDKQHKKGLRPTLSDALREFRGRARRVDIEKWFKSVDKRGDVLDEIVETDPKKKALAENMYNHIDSWHTPNEYHQADLLFLPHDELDAAEKRDDKHQTLREALSGSGLFDHDTLPHHRRFELVGGGAGDRPRRQVKKPERLGMVEYTGPVKRESAKRKRDDEQPDLPALSKHNEFDGVYKYCLTVVDVATRYKGAYPLKSKTGEEVFQGLRHIYSNSVLAWPSILHTDHGSEFVKLRQILKNPKYKIDTVVRLEIPFYHLPFVESFNQKLTEKIMRTQMDEELGTGLVSRKWVDFLPGYIDDLNRTKQAGLNGLTPSMAMTKTYVPQKEPGPPNKSNPMYEDWEKKASLHFEVGDHVRHWIPKDQYQETSGDKKIVKDTRMRRAGDPSWSVRKFKVTKIFKPHSDNPKSLWLHDIWPLDYPEPHKFKQGDDVVDEGVKVGKKGPDVRPDEHFGYTRSFTYFQLKKTT